MTQQVIEFLEQYQAMRTAEKHFAKSAHPVDRARLLQAQTKLDAAAPILLDLLIDDDWIVTLEEVNTEDGVIENVLYDAEWCDLQKMEESIAFIKSKYVIKRNPNYQVVNHDNEKATEPTA